MTGELAAIAAIRAMLPGPPPGEVWIGDDAAVLPAPCGPLLLATDSVAAGVHADLTLTGLDDLGWKALSAAVSDVAAMGGEPRHAVVSVAGPPGTDLLLLYQGIRAASAELGCPVVGGDLANAGTLVVTVAVTGTCDGPPVLRSGARPGDGIWSTGPLGAAAAGLRCYRALADGGPPPPGVAGATLETLLRAHARPVAQVAAGRAARQAGATAMIDVSDGLAVDLRHVAEASGVGVRLDSVPLAAGATQDEALCGGDDYVLAFCAPDPARVLASFAGAGLAKPLRVGTCTDDVSERSLAGRALPTGGWEHSW
ncbi:MAG: thiamine-phosphate kinase [Acidimicrobiales bacterium]